MRTHVKRLMVGMLVTPLLLGAVWAATNGTAAGSPVVTKSCLNGSNWEKC